LAPPLAIIFLETGSTPCNMIDDVIKIWMLQTPPNNRFD